MARSAAASGAARTARCIKSSPPIVLRRLTGTIPLSPAFAAAQSGLSAGTQMAASPGPWANTRTSSPSLVRNPANTTTPRASSAWCMIAWSWRIVPPGPPRFGPADGLYAGSFLDRRVAMICRQAFTLVPGEAAHSG